MTFYQYYVNNREADNNLKKRISTGDICFCERHFVKEDIEFTSKIVSDFPLVFVLLCKDDIWANVFSDIKKSVAS